jgi:type I restriction enzyme S subunit
MSEATYTHRPLGTLVREHVGGGTPPRQTPSYWKGDIPWASVKDFSEGADVITNTQEHITPSGLNASASRLISAGTPLVCTRMAVGRTAMPSTAIAINQDVKALFPAQGVSPAYLLKLLQFMQPQAESRAVGSTVKGIRIRDYLSIEAPIAGPEAQVAIAAVLKTLDTAIHETGALIAKLKAVKQGLLHDLLTRGIDANGELRPLQPEAPHLYKQSPLGWIPKGWAFGELQTWLNGRPRNGYSPQVAGEWTGIQMLGLGCLTHEGFEPLQLKPAPRGDRRLVPAMLADGDLLVSRSNTRDLVGLAGVYRDVGTRCSYPDLMMRLNASDETRGEFLELVLRSPQLRRQIEAHAVGTSGSMVKVSGRIVSALMVTMPPIDEQERILICLNAARSRIDAEIEELSTLHELKSGLMDDLLTGRVRVTPLLASESEGSA